jgi:hypothetical protein
VGWFYLNINWPKFFVSTPSAAVFLRDSRRADSFSMDNNADIVAVQLYVSLISTLLLSRSDSALRPGQASVGEWRYQEGT